MTEKELKKQIIIVERLITSLNPVENAGELSRLKARLTTLQQQSKDLTEVGEEKASSKRKRGSLNLFPVSVVVDGSTFTEQALVSCSALAGSICSQVQLGASSNQQVMMALDRTVHVLDFGAKMTPGVISGFLPVGKTCSGSSKRVSARRILALQRKHAIGADRLQIQLQDIQAQAFVVQAQVSCSEADKISFVLNLLVVPQGS